MFLLSLNSPARCVLMVHTVNPTTPKADFMKSKFLSLVAGLALAALVATPGYASWVGSVNPNVGNSVITTSGDNANAVLDYTFNQGVFTATWTFASNQALLGDTNYDWSYSGFHNIFQGTSSLAFIVHHTGPNTDTIYNVFSDGNSWNSSGFVALDADAGDLLSVRATGHSFDAISYNAGGHIVLTQVPEPASLVLLGLGLAGLGWSRRRNA